MTLGYNKVNYTDLTAEQKTFYVRALLSRLTPEYVHRNYGQVVTVPENEGLVVEWRRFNALSPATTPLTEGTPPSESSFTITQVYATLQQYGAYLAGTDVVLKAGKDKVQTECAILLGDQMAETVDLITRDVLITGTVVQYVADSLSWNTLASTDSLLTATELREAVRTLKRSNAKPINGKWIALIHSDTWYDLMGDADIKATVQYTQGNNLFSGAIPDWMGIQFVESTQAKVWASYGLSAADVYATLVLGRDAYGVVELSGGNVDYIFHPPGSGGTSDPMDQRWTAAWKALYTAAILQNSAMVRIMHVTSYDLGA